VAPVGQEKEADMTCRCEDEDATIDGLVLVMLSTPHKDRRALLDEWILNWQRGIKLAMPDATFEERAAVYEHFTGKFFARLQAVAYSGGAYGTHSARPN
jgi:hypothetical protein